MDILAPLVLQVAQDGSASFLHKDTGLAGRCQDALVAPPPPSSYLRLLEEASKPWDGSALSKLPAPGHVLTCVFQQPVRWPECSLPTCLVQPQLPDSQGRHTWCQQQVSPSELARQVELGLQRRQATGDPGQAANWRGMAVSGPTYLPGALAAADLPPTPAQQEAASGAWLAQYESGRLPRTMAPGLAGGVFGPWAAQEEEEAAAGSAPLPSPSPSALRVENVFQNMWQMEDDVVAALREEEEEASRQQTEASSVLDKLAQQSGAEAAAAPGPQGAAAQAGDAAASVDSMLAVAPARSAAATAVKAAKADAKGRLEWAVRGGIPDLASAWATLQPQLALHYPFELDVFQKEAALHLEGGRSVFVAAHTSAGKTVVAEYAFALATKHCTKAIYTSPIKTISNQKFRDFSGKFEVGLLTGDVQIRPTSPCLIMTTEILRSMLYKGADMIRDIEWVVFDEVHYVNDVDRGVVWEEVIIMLPPHVSMVLLSATVPNVMDFADWVGRTKRKVVRVTGTNKRPVPLEHQLYYNGELFTVYRSDMFLVEGVRGANNAWKKKTAVPETRKDEKAQRPTGRGDGGGGPNRGGHGGGGGRGPPARFNSGADSARRQLMSAGKSGGQNSGPAALQQQRSGLMELVKLLAAKGMLPVAVFIFSKKKCDAAGDMVSSLDLTTSVEKHAIHTFCEKCLARLKEGDRRLPQILRLRELMKRGLAVHHAGLLPIMKEMVEMLFCQGYIKVLFCTETFAMGVNAPTRTVVFHSLRKHDGKNFRYLLPGEYTQMAGRAGRRGLDTVGHVIIACWDDILPETELRNILTGRGVTLASRFRLTYSMILNLLRVEDLKIEDMLKRSFAEWRAQKAQPELLNALQAVEKKLQALASRPWPGCYLGCSREEVEAYYRLSSQLDEVNAKLQAVIMSSKYVQQLLAPGRVVLLRNPVNGLTELGVVLGGPEEAAGGRTGAGLGALRAPMGGAAAAAASASAAADSPDRKLYVLTLHPRGEVDTAAAAAQAAQADAKPAAPPASKLPDEFAGMVLKGRGASTARQGPGPLPRYGEVAGLSWMVAEVGSRAVVGLAKSKFRVEAEALLGGEWEGQACQRELTAALRTLQKIQDDPEPLPLMDAAQDFKINDFQTVQDVRKRDELLAQLAAMRPHKCPALSEQFAMVRGLDELGRQRAQLRHTLSDASLTQLPEFHQRVGVLQELGYLAEDRTVQLKGRVACEINSTQDELVASEMVFSGLLTELRPEEAVALISALVFQEKSDVEPSLPPRLAQARQQLQELVVGAAKVQAKHGLQVAPDEYLAEVMHCGLMEVVYEWACGTPFEDICGLTDVMEGSIVRAIVRLDQACRELKDAARIMGNTTLFQQMEAASAAIKRDVIFAASLYVA